jgi:hypothetical protein
MPTSDPESYDAQGYGPVPGAGPMVQGKVAILAIAFLGVAASVGSCVYYARLQQRPLALWGSEPARLMLRAPTVLAYNLAPASDQEKAAPSDLIEIDGQRFRLVNQRDVSRAPGFSHIRQSFVHDASFTWDAAPDDCQPTWTHALRFVEGDSSATVVLAFDCQRAALATADPAAKDNPTVVDLKAHSASIKPVSKAIQDFFAQYEPKAPPAEQPAGQPADQPAEEPADTAK